MKYHWIFVWKNKPFTLWNQTFDCLFSAIFQQAHRNMSCMNHMCLFSISSRLQMELWQQVIQRYRRCLLTWPRCPMGVRIRRQDLTWSTESRTSRLGIYAYCWDCRYTFNILILSSSLTHPIIPSWTLLHLYTFCLLISSTTWHASVELLLYHSYWLKPCVWGRTSTLSAS